MCQQKGEEVARPSRGNRSTSSQIPRGLAAIAGVGQIAGVHHRWGMQLRATRRGSTRACKHVLLSNMQPRTHTWSPARNTGMPQYT